MSFKYIAYLYGVTKYNLVLVKNNLVFIWLSRFCTVLRGVSYCYVFFSNFGLVKSYTYII